MMTVTPPPTHPSSATALLAAVVESADKSFTVRMLGGTYIGYAKATEEWWAPVNRLLERHHLSDRPVHFGEVFATLYHNLGIYVTKVTIPDLSGRPQYLVDAGCEPMKELI